jgi:replicative DNA helicase
MATDRDQASLPWSAEAEQSLLGALLLDSDALGRISHRGVEASHFFDHRNREVWSAIGAMVARREPVDVITVFECLRDAGADERAGGLAYLNALAQSVPSASNVGRYADVVIEKATRRAVIAAAAQVQDLAREASAPDEILDRAASIFAGIRRTRAASAPRSLSELVGDRIEYWQALSEGDVQPGIATGLGHLDEAFGGGIKPGKVIVLAARPSVGKTSLATQIGINIAAQGHRVLMISQEMPACDLVDRIVANLGRVSLGSVTTGRCEGDDSTRLAEGSERAARLPFYVDDQPALTLLDIRSKARQVQQAGGLALLVVDYVQLCASAGGVERRHHQIEQISRGMKQLAKELGVCVLLLSQLSRGGANAEPELDHLKESGAIEEDADAVILLHPTGKGDAGAVQVLAKIPKNRQGRRGRFALELHGRTQRWTASTLSQESAQ